MKRKPRGYWTKERCRLEFLKYNSIVEVQKKSRAAYNCAWRNGWLNELSEPLRRIEPSKEECRLSAQKYESKSAWRTKDYRCYIVSVKNGWYDDFTQHFKKKRSYNTEIVSQTAREYATKKEFHDAEPSMYEYAQRHGIIDEICSHMDKLGNWKYRKLYIFEFEDNYAYIGLTYNITRRKYDHFHKKNSAVYKHLQENPNVKFKFKVVSDWLSMDEAGKQEDSLIEKYREEGWIMLNRKKGGGLGSAKSLVHTKEECHAAALKYKHRVDFHFGDMALYSYAYEHGWLEDICSHMIPCTNPKLYWTDERLRAAVKECKYKVRLQEKYPSAYAYLQRHKAIDDYFDYSGRYDSQTKKE
jgi:predicted GIY-YIG superfamily endonuclease